MNTTVQSAGDGDRYLRVSRGAVPISRIVAPPPVARVGLSKSMGAPELDAGKRNRRTRGIPQLTVPSETSANGNAYDKRTSKKAPLLDFVPLDDLNTTRRCSVESIRLRDLEKELYAELVSDHQFIGQSYNPSPVLSRASPTPKSWTLLSSAGSPTLLVMSSHSTCGNH